MNLSKVTNVKLSLKISIISMLLTLFCITPIMAAGTPKDNASAPANDRVYILSKWAYTELTDKPSPELNYSEETANSYLNMSDAAFEKAMNANLQKVINRQKNGAHIIWNEDFIDEVKTLSPNLNQTVQQIDLQSVTSYIPGSNTQTWYAYGDNAVGIHLFGLKTRIMWYWDSTKLTSISPSTTGETYMPTWSYVGLSGNDSWYTGSTMWSTWKQGKFRCTINGHVVQEGTTEMTINIFAGGTYNPASGGY